MNQLHKFYLCINRFVFVSISPLLIMGCYDEPPDSSAIQDFRHNLQAQQARDSKSNKKKDPVIDPEPLEKHKQAVTRFRALGGTVNISTLGEVMAIDLTGSTVANEDLAHLVGMTNLFLLNLDGTSIGDQGLIHIQDLPNLKILRLSRTKITNEGLAHIKNLPNLKKLHLNDTQITDEGMQNLKQNPNLSRIYLMGASVSEKAEQIIQKTLPKCRIKH